jgi:hypothetical protein
VSLSVFDAQPTADGFVITLASDSGLHRLEGSREEIARLARVMRQVSVLAPLYDGEPIWLDDVIVGCTVVRLGLTSEGGTRLLLHRP